MGIFLDCAQLFRALGLTLSLGLTLFVKRTNYCSGKKNSFKDGNHINLKCNHNLDVILKSYQRSHRENNIMVYH